MNYQVWIDNDRGERLVSLQNLADIDYVGTLNNPGWFRVGIPELAIEPSRDLIVEIWRQPDGAAPILDSLGFLRKWKKSRTSVTLEGPGKLNLLNRRIVAYNAGSAEADQTDYADDMLKEIFDHNLGADATDTDRRWSGLGLTSAAQLSLAPSIPLAFSRRNVLDVMQDVCNASRQSGTELYFDLVPAWSAGRLTLQFVTYIGQPGTDRTGPSNTFVLAETWGNMDNAEIEYDYTNELTVVYAGGQGEEADRVVETRTDATRLAASAWNRIEGWVDARNAATTAAVQSAGDAALAEARPRLRITGRLMDVKGSLYGKDWYIGDRVKVRIDNQEYSALIRTVHVSRVASTDTVDASVEIDL